MIKLKNILIESEASDVVGTARDKIKAIAVKVDNLGLGAPIAEFLTRIAAVESCYGLNRRAGKDIWQIDSIGFEDTQNLASHPGLQKKFDILKAKGIDWPSKTHIDIESNIFLNCIAARLLLGNKPGSIPNDLEGQATYWKTHYNSSSDFAGGHEDDFIDKNSGDGVLGCIDYVR